MLKSLFFPIFSGCGSMSFEMNRSNGLLLFGRSNTKQACLKYLTEHPFIME
jgi:hypothetical protein